MLNFLNKLFLGFCEPATPIMEGIIDFHNYIFFFLVLIFVFVFIIMCNILIYFWYFFENPTIKWDVLFRDFIFFNNRVTHGTLLEIIWTTIPAIILVGIAFPSFSLLYSMDEVMIPAFTLKVIGHQWYWSYEYNDQVVANMCSDLFSFLSVANEKEKFLKDSDSSTDTNFSNLGKWSVLRFQKLIKEMSQNFKGENPIVGSISADKLNIDFDSYMVPESDLNLGDHRLLEVTEHVVLPINTYIRILVSSVDVLHSFAVPSLGLKVDAVPGRLNQLSVYIKRHGVFYGQCSELCGVSHGMMPITVRAVSLKDYVNWLLTIAASK